jgi:cytochrome oxidase Cu insertion factor (SCO1/SenC/PrrC family)
MASDIVHGICEKLHESYDAARRLGAGNRHRPRKSAEFYSPPYLFKGPRPTITQVPTQIRYGSNFFVGTPDATNIASVSLIRTGAVTHFFDQNERYLPLSFTQTSGGLTVTAPLNANLAPPGYYMLFVVNGAGVPSIAPFCAGAIEDGGTVMRLLIVALGAMAITFDVGVVRAQEFRLGGRVSDFTVQDTRGRLLHYKTMKGHVTVVMFFSTRCPISNAFNHRRNTIYDDYKGRVKFVVVDSNSNESVDEVRAYASDVGFDFPVYKDTDNVTADRFGVLTTTDAFVIDSSGVIQYHGYVEDSPNAERSTKQGLRLAIDAVVGGKPVEMSEPRPEVARYAGSIPKIRIRYPREN